MCWASMASSEQLSLHEAGSVYAPLNYLLSSRQTQIRGDCTTPRSCWRRRHASGRSDRERSLQALLTVNLLKRLESSVYAFRLTLRNPCGDNHARHAGPHRAAFHAKDGRSTPAVEGPDRRRTEQTGCRGRRYPRLSMDLSGSRKAEAVGGKVKNQLGRHGFAALGA